LVDFAAPAITVINQRYCLSGTRSKISATLTGRKDSDETRVKKSESQKGANNPFYGKGPGAKALDIAAEKAGTKVFVYDAKDFILVKWTTFSKLEAGHSCRRCLRR
jgi:hypothetical protein